MADFIKFFCAERNASKSDIVINESYKDSISGTEIPRIDCHVWFEIDGKIDDFTPIVINLPLPFGKIYCTEYIPYNKKLQTDMRTYFDKLWLEKRKALTDHQFEYICQQDTCWMRCGVLHLSDPVKYSLDKLRIGSLGFVCQEAKYWHFG